MCASWRWLVVPAMLLLIASCGTDHAAKQIRELRLSGQPDSARSLALTLLSENANRMNVWREFARTSTEISRLSDDIKDPRIAETCVQAALICAAVHLHKKSENRHWFEAGRMASTEVARQVSEIMNTCNNQTQTAAALQQMKERSPEQNTLYGDALRMENLVQSYRNDARRVLTLSVIWRRLLNILPELNQGASSFISAELEQRQNEWIAALQLEAGYTSPIQKRARERLDTALERLQEDLDDLGFFLVRSVTENGVLP